MIWLAGEPIKGTIAARIIRVMMVIDFTAVPLRAVMLLRGHPSI